ncbi:winged helix-turn-helix transcriptional regulator [Duganella phyllosphaerae]|uniref:Putative HTH-type transcriptional regulator YybR n=1 Tax=Duganella phyllosphaerae TaxID=762836 RepID=A0A1E7WSR4_9BURK|nr:helix-turn-helix domain-containing protein [Duganella phyllosphaerae]OFA02484.1 putative HTH-type transcriptional regulator YybR [Duganella phyllosphaerae]
MTDQKSLRAALRESQLQTHLQARVLVAECPSRAVLGHITSRWGTLVLIVLLERTHRFSELRRGIGGVSEKMLAQTLDALADDGLVLRVAQQAVPPHVEYSLTKLGREAATRLEILVNWIETNYPRIEAAQRAAATEAA